MSREWKPGDVAMVRAFDAITRTFEPQMVIRTGRGDWAHPNDGLWDDEFVQDARPLVVIDPNDREQVARLADAFCEERWSHQPGSEECDPLTRDAMQAALRSLIDPPEPEEPESLADVLANINRRLREIEARIHAANKRGRRA